MTEPVQTLSASERAYQAVRDGILEGRYLPGVMLGEATLATGFGLSRTPIRTALARLQDEGWILVYPKRGALVQGLTERQVEELADARFVLETTAVDRAQAELRQRLVGRLEESVQRQRQAFAAGELTTFIELTLQFHRGFVESAGSGVLLELYDRLADRHRFVLFASGEHLISRCAEIIAEHEQLIAHLRSGDTNGFAQTLRAHIAENVQVSGRPTAAPGRHLLPDN